MPVVNARTGRPTSLRFAHELFGRERMTIDDAVAGDIVGIVNAGGVLVGDTLYEDEPVTFPPIPTFAPERFNDRARRGHVPLQALPRRARAAR